MTKEQQEAVERLNGLAAGWECAAKLEDAIVAAYQPELDSFSGTDKDVPHDLRLIRAALDARSNRDAFTKDAKALRTLLSLTEAPEAEAVEPVAWTGVTHDLKTWPTAFEAVAAGLKPWELRKNDRNYQVGDRLRLRRWVPLVEKYTGEEVERQVVWMLEGPAFGLPEGYVIMSLSAPPTIQADLDRAVEALKEIDRDGREAFPASPKELAEKAAETLATITKGKP